MVAVFAAVGAGAFALGAPSEESAPAPAAKARVVEQPAELPPLPKLRPKVVEPVAGDTGTTVTTDPGLEDVGPKPTRAASGARVRRSVGRTDITKATALSNGVALPPLEAPEEVKQIIEAGNIIARSPYLWGGGHGKWLDEGYDCSGSVSFALGGRRAALRPARVGAADELGRGRPRQVGHDLREPGARVHGGGGDPLRHLGSTGHRLALAERDALHRRVRRPPSARPLIRCEPHAARVAGADEMGVSVALLSNRS